MMKHRGVILLFTSIILIWNSNINALAMTTGFATEAMDSTSEQTFSTNINLSLINDEIKKSPIVCFDVNDYNSLIAIGSENSEQKTICVYTLDGKFVYGYQFRCSGDFGIEWDKDDLMIYFVRSEVAALFNAAGEMKEIAKIQKTTENNNYWNHSVFSTERNIGDNQYIIKNDMGLFNLFAMSYSQLIQIDKYGTTTIIYDAGSTQITKIILVFLFILIFLSIVILVIVRQICKLKCH